MSRDQPFGSRVAFELQERRENALPATARGCPAVPGASARWWRHHAPPRMQRSICRGARARCAAYRREQRALQRSPEEARARRLSVSSPAPSRSPGWQRALTSSPDNAAATSERSMSRHNQHRSGLAGKRGLDHAPHHRRAADVGEQLVRVAHTRRAAGGQHDRSHVRRVAAIVAPRLEKTRVAMFASSCAPKGVDTVRPSRSHEARQRCICKQAGRRIRPRDRDHESTSPRRSDRRRQARISGSQRDHGARVRPGAGTSGMSRASGGPASGP